MRRRRRRASRRLRSSKGSRRKETGGHRLQQQQGAQSWTPRVCSYSASSLLPSILTLCLNQERSTKRRLA